MPGFAAYVVAAHIASDMQFEARQLMQADDDGMVERFIPLEGIKVPRMLSWAEERALRRDLVDGARAVLNGQWHRYRRDFVAFAEAVWQQPLQDWQKDVLRNWGARDPDFFKRQYLGSWELPEFCRCGLYRLASVSKPHRIYGKAYFGCHNCGLPIYGGERYS